MPRGAEPVLIGKIAGTHGIRGQLKAVSFSGEFDTLASLKTVMLKAPDGKLETFAVTTAAVHRNRVLLSLNSFSNINEVLHLVGRELYVRRDQFPPLPEGEYYWCDLIGLTVITEDGTRLGTISDIIATGSNDVYVVEGDGREYMIPAIEDVVLDVDLEQGAMTVSPLEGLFDL